MLEFSGAPAGSPAASPSTASPLGSSVRSNQFVDKYRAILKRISAFATVASQIQSILPRAYDGGLLDELRVRAARADRHHLRRRGRSGAALRDGACEACEATEPACANHANYTSINVGIGDKPVNGSQTDFLALI